jgi:hypothetical protein
MFLCIVIAGKWLCFRLNKQSEWRFSLPTLRHRRDVACYVSTTVRLPFKQSQNRCPASSVNGKNTVQFISAEREKGDLCSQPSAPSLRTRRVKQSSVPVYGLLHSVDDVRDNLNCLPEKSQCAILKLLSINQLITSSVET